MVLFFKKSQMLGTILVLIRSKLFGYKIGWLYFISSTCVCVCSLFVFFLLSSKTGSYRIKKTIKIGTKSRVAVDNMKVVFLLLHLCVWNGKLLVVKMPKKWPIWYEYIWIMFQKIHDKLTFDVYDILYSNFNGSEWKKCSQIHFSHIEKNIVKNRQFSSKIKNHYWKTYRYYGIRVRVRNVWY